MLEEIEDVSPTIQLLVNEVSKCESWIDARKRIRAVLPELKILARSFRGYTPSEIAALRSPQVFDIHLHGALDVVSRHGCETLQCRINSADRIARSVGLIADRVWLTDTITDRLLDFGRATNERIDRLLEDVLVVDRLAPLIKAGLVKFRVPYYVTCESCDEKLNYEVADLVVRIGEKFRRDFKVEARDEGGYLLRTGKCFEPGMVYVDPHSLQVPRLSELVERSVRRELRSILHVAREAALTGGSIFSNSRVGLAGILEQEGRLISRRSMMLLEREREISIPWVSELSPSQVVQLRNEASSALPAFRSQMTKVFSLSSEESGKSSALDAIEGLRAQAFDVKAELDAKRKYSSRYWKVTYGLLGLGLSAYGVASENLTSGVAGLLPLIQLLISHKTGHETDVEKLLARPGYVLLRAKDILAHSHG